jgi:hypothetical protein
VNTWLDYDALDSNIVTLVRALNAFPGITTIGSCGGHDNPTGVQRSAGEWFVTFRVAHTKGGWRALEYIAGVTLLDPWRTSLTVNTSQPGHATGRSLFFALEGWEDADPDRVAAYLTRVKEQR